MNMAATEEQLLLREALARFLRESVTLAELGRAADSDPPFDAQLWHRLVELGVTGLMVPAEQGGSGLGLVEASIVAQELGFASAPVPFAGAVVMASQAFLMSGDPVQQAQWLPRIARGEVRMAVAFASGLRAQAGRADISVEPGWVRADIDAVSEAECCTHLLLISDEGRMALVDVAAAHIESRPSVDALRRICRVRVDAAPEAVLSKTDNARAAALEVLDSGRMALACDTFGAAQAMLEKAVSYAKDRVQFGRVIGSFQGVKYMCADMVIMLEPCRALLWHAASVQGRGNEGRVAALQAKAHVADMAREVSRLAIEVHGGVGFTDMLGLPTWFRRISFNRQLLGGPEHCRDEAARIQGWAS